MRVAEPSFFRRIARHPCVLEPSTSRSRALGVRLRAGALELSDRVIPEADVGCSCQQSARQSRLPSSRRFAATSILSRANLLVSALSACQT
jgi:hypothetical protein